MTTHDFGADSEKAEARAEQAELRAEQAEARTEQAEARTEQAEGRTQQAEARTQQAEGRTQQAEARTEQAEGRTEQAEGRTEQAEARTEQAEGRFDRAVSRSEQAEGRTKEAEERIDQAISRTEQAEVRRDQAEGRTEQAVTRTEQSELMVHASELNYRRLFEAAQVGILILDADTGRIRDANPFVVELLACPLSEMVDNTVAELGPFKNMEPDSAMLDHLQKNGYVRYKDLSVETRDNRRLTVEFVGKMYHAGEKTVIQCNIRDITEIHDLNAKLEQRVIERTEKLEAFSYSVSHDLRAPLYHVIGYLDLLEKDLGTPLPEKILDHLTRISGAANRMTNLIDDLLAFARSGRSEVKKTEVDLGMLVEEILEDFRNKTKDRNIAWAIHPLPVVQADRALLRLALINLISNAIKFTVQRAEAKIEIGSTRGSDGKGVIYIRDNGAGFDPEYSEKLFGVFQRLHSQEEFEGTGIGLANVQSIIHRHGGQVWAEGKVNAGATFYFSIPEQTMAHCV